MEWGEHHPCLFEGTERFFRAGYNTNLIGSWLPALDGVVDKLAARSQGRRCRMRARRQHHPDGADVSGFGVRRLRLSRRIDQCRHREGGGRGRFECAIRGRRCRRLPGQGFRPDRVLRLPARHGRSGQCVPARARGDQRRRHRDDRGAVRQRPGGRQPEPGGPSHVRRVHADLRAGFAWRARALRSALRPAKPGCARSSSTAAASRDSGAPPRHRSTSCSRRGRSRVSARGRERPQRLDLNRIQRRPHVLAGLGDVGGGDVGGVDRAPHRRQRGLAQQRDAVGGAVAVQSSASASRSTSSAERHGFACGAQDFAAGLGVRRLDEHQLLQPARAAAAPGRSGRAGWSRRAPPRRAAARCRRVRSAARPPPGR